MKLPGVDLSDLTKHLDKLDLFEKEMVPLLRSINDNTSRIPELLEQILEALNNED